MNEIVEERIKITRGEKMGRLFDEGKERLVRARGGG